MWALWTETTSLYWTFTIPQAWDAYLVAILREVSSSFMPVFSVKIVSHDFWSEFSLKLYSSVGHQHPYYYLAESSDECIRNEHLLAPLTCIRSETISKIMTIVWWPPLSFKQSLLTYTSTTKQFWILVLSSLRYERNVPCSKVADYFFYWCYLLLQHASLNNLISREERIWGREKVEGRDWGEGREGKWQNYSWYVMFERVMMNMMMMITTLFLY